MKLRTQFSVPQQTSETELKKPNPPTKEQKKRAKFKDKTYVGKTNARI
jgi:hypothetical protein